jgi:hypothetical protein
VKGIAVYPIHGISDRAWSVHYEPPILPVRINDSLTIEDLTDLKIEESFSWARDSMGSFAFDSVKIIRYGLACRYETPPGSGTEEDIKAESEVRLLAACLMVIRPMRQNAGAFRGKLRDDGSLDLEHFEHPTQIEVPSVHKLNSLRKRDAERLRRIWPTFEQAFNQQYWKVRMSVEFLWTGYYSDQVSWKPRFMLWMSALESLFTSQSPEHRGTKVAIARIWSLLGAATAIYEQSELPLESPVPPYTVSDVLPDLYAVRNCLAHGDRVPDEFFTKYSRIHLGQAISSIEVLQESVLFIVRESIMRILEGGLLANFASNAASEAYYSGLGLVRSRL